MNYWYILATIPVFGICVLIHELGHFITARWAGIRVEEFGLGLPPRMVGFRKRESGGWEVLWFGKPSSPEDSFEPGSREASSTSGVDKAVSSIRPDERHHTIYSINWLPIGGFVRMPGENGETNDDRGRYDPGSFAAKPAGKRIIVLVAGVTMNIILAMVLFIVAYGVGQPTYAAQVGSVVAGSPAAQAGLRSGDSILRVNGQSVQQFSDIQDITNNLVNSHQSANTIPVTIVGRHQGEQGQFTTTINVRVHPPQGQGPMGIAAPQTVTLLRAPFWEAPIRGVGETFSVTGQFINTIGQMIAGTIKPQIAGPVGIAKLTGEVAQSVPTLGLWPILSLTAILNINLAIVNILPFPALDGGRIFLILLELLRGGKRLKPEVEGIINLVGMGILLTLMVIITVSDVMNFSSL